VAKDDIQNLIGQGELRNDENDDFVEFEDPNQQSPSINNLPV
jgi:hypothetical protein